MTVMDKISCRTCGDTIFNIGLTDFGCMYIACVGCGDIFVIGPDLTVSSILSLLIPKVYDIRKEDILYRIAKQEYPICAEGFHYMEPIKNGDDELQHINMIFDDEKNVELGVVEYGNIIYDYLRSLNIKEWEYGDCRERWLGHAKEVVDRDVGPACPICGSGNVWYI